MDPPPSPRPPQWLMESDTLLLRSGASEWSQDPLSSPLAGVSLLPSGLGAEEVPSQGDRWVAPAWPWDLLRPFSER